MIVNEPQWRVGTVRVEPGGPLPGTGCWGFERRPKAWTLRSSSTRALDWHRSESDTIGSVARVVCASAPTGPPNPFPFRVETPKSSEP